MGEDGYLGYIDIENVKENTETEFISWDELFMKVAELFAKRSKDPSTKVGAVLVRDNKIVSAGYNGMPYTNRTSNNDEVYPWTKGSDNKYESKYTYVVHAELNAILNAEQSVKGCTLYVTLNCCNECAKAIIQSGIKRVVYKTDRDEDIFNIAKFMLANAGIEVIKYNE